MLYLQALCLLALTELYGGSLNGVLAERSNS